MSGEIRAVPVMEKVRAVGSQKLRANEVSVSDRSGVPELRSRVMMRLRRSEAEAVPAARRRSSGMTMVSFAETPGILTSANPTELREETALWGSEVATP